MSFCIHSKPSYSRRMIPRKAVFLAEVRLSNSVLPTTQICASSGQQVFYFHPFVISSVHNYEWERWRRGRGKELQNILQKALPFYFEVLITTDDLRLQEMTSVPRRDAPGFLSPGHGCEIRQNSGPRLLKSCKKIFHQQLASVHTSVEDAPASVTSSKNQIDTGSHSQCSWHLCSTQLLPVTAEGLPC